jgi:hypothetical protein
MEKHIADMQKAAAALAASLGPEDTGAHDQLAELITAQSALMWDMSDRMSAIEHQERLGRQQALASQRSTHQAALKATRDVAAEHQRALKAEVTERNRAIAAESKAQESEQRRDDRAGIRDSVVTAGGAVVGGLLAIGSFIVGVHGISGVDTAALQQVVIPTVAGIAGAVAPALAVAARLKKKVAGKERVVAQASDGLDAVRAAITRELAKALVSSGSSVLDAASLARDIVAAA